MTDAGTECHRMGHGGKLVAMLLGPLLLFGCSLQDRLLYNPDRRVPADEELVQRGIRYWPASAGYRGFLADVPEGRVMGTVVVFHGNAATAADRDYYAHPLQRLGYRVILAEYPGYGRRKGKLGEDSFVRDALETIRLASATFPGPVYLIGESLGAAVAASAVKAGTAPIEGIILFTPWETLELVAKEHFPWLPVRFLMSDRYDTARNLRGYGGPIAIVAAERDSIIPASHAENLHRSLPTRKMIITIPGADHNDWPSVITTGTWERLMAFVNSEGVPGTKGTASATGCPE